jgi:predicted nucleic acid-binding protein
VSKRDEIKRLSPLSDMEVEQLLSAFYSVCEWTDIHFLWRPNLSDEGDNFLIELAVAGNAKVITTNNIKDLRNAELMFLGLSIVRPEHLLEGK